MKCSVSIPCGFLDHLKRSGETEIGFQVVSLGLKDGRAFDRMATSERCIVDGEGTGKFPFRPITSLL